jgi:hypothetical protein
MAAPEQRVRSGRETLLRATHVLDALKIILIPSFIVLSSGSGFELGNAKFIINICIIFHIVFTAQESGGTTSSCSPCATPPGTLEPISTRHLGFSSATGGSRYFRQIILVVDSLVGVSIQGLVGCIISDNSRYSAKAGRLECLSLTLGGRR